MYEIHKTPVTCENTTSDPCHHLGDKFCTDVDMLLLSLLERQKKLSLKIQYEIMKEDT